MFSCRMCSQKRETSTILAAAGEEDGVMCSHLKGQGLGIMCSHLRRNVCAVKETRTRKNVVSFKEARVLIYGDKDSKCCILI